MNEKQGQFVKCVKTFQTRQHPSEKIKEGWELKVEAWGGEKMVLLSSEFLDHKHWVDKFNIGDLIDIETGEIPVYPATSPDSDMASITPGWGSDVATPDLLPETPGSLSFVPTSHASITATPLQEGPGNEGIVRVAPTLAQRMREEAAQEIRFISQQAQRMQSLLHGKRAEVEAKGSELMPKLQRKMTANRVEALQYVAEAINLSIPVDRAIFEELFDQYDVEQVGFLESSQLKKLIQEHAIAQLALCNKALTSGELEEALEGNPVGPMIIAAARTKIQQNIIVHQSMINSVDDAHADTTLRKMDIDGDGRISKIEFFSRVEQTFWFDQQIAARTQKLMMDDLQRGLWR